MVQYEKRYEKYMKTIDLYCTVMMKNNYVVSILTGPDTLQLVYSGVVYHFLFARKVNDVS